MYPAFVWRRSPGHDDIRRVPVLINSSAMDGICTGHKAGSVGCNCGRAESALMYAQTCWRQYLPRFADHQDGERARYRSTLCGPPTRGRYRCHRRSSALLRHREQAAGFAVECDGAGAVHGLQVLLYLKAGRALLFHDGHGAVAVGAECFHCCGIEYCSVRPAGKRRVGENLAVLRAQDHHRRLLCGRISRPAACRKQNLVFDIEREAIAAAFVHERVVRNHLHRLHVDCGHAADRVLHDDVQHALTVSDPLLRRASQVDGAEYGAILGVYHGRVLGGMAEDVNTPVERVEVDTVWPCRANIDALDQRHRLGVEHRNLGMIAGEAVIRLWINRSALAANSGDFTERLQRVEVEDGQTCRNRRHLGGGVDGGHRWCGTARNVEPAAVRVGVNVVPATLPADTCGVEDFVRTILLSYGE